MLLTKKVMDGEFLVKKVKNLGRKQETYEFFSRKKRNGLKLGFH